MREYDPELYDFLLPRAKRDGKSVSEIENSTLLSGITFFNLPMDFDSIPNCAERSAERMKWHAEALKTLSGCDIVFADPDNGLSITKKAAHKGAQKYILPCEIEEYFRNNNQQVVYYHHRPRKKGDAWMKDKTMILEKLPEAKLLAVSFNRWSCRTYIFVLHEDQYERYSRLLDSFLQSDWGQLRVGGKTAFTHEELEY